ncbi:unnamed protein product [Fusarium fujikuroi]|nr:unnamed protein product [Fusarium fujikuroi]
MSPSADSIVDTSFQGQRLSIVVTGGASGIGLAITRHFAAQGHMVAVLDVNSKTGPDAPTVGVGLAVHYMLKNEVGSRLPNSRGSIVCTSSSAAIYPFPVSPLYSAAKSGIIGLVRSMAIRLEEPKIQINALAPGVLETNITPDKELFKAMIITPLSTLTKAVSQFVTDPSRTGQVAELNEETITLRPHAEYADAGAEHNNKMFYKLGHA